LSGCFEIGNKIVMLGIAGRIYVFGGKTQKKFKVEGLA
jgi:hypothetical protein